MLHYSHAKKRLVKGVNLLTMMIRYGDVSFPIGYEVVKKDIHYCDIKTKKEKRQASISKNTYFRMLIGQAVTNCVTRLSSFLISLRHSHDILF